MTTLAHDETAPVATGSRPASGLAFAVLSAVSFGLSGSLASPMLDAGGARARSVLIRVGIAAVVVLPLGLVALRGRWGAVRRNAGLISAFGAVAVAGAQFCYFSAVQHMQVGPAILIEYRPRRGRGAGCGCGTASAPGR